VPKSDDRKLLQLGKQTALLLDMTAVDRKSMMFTSFLRGLAQGFGAVIGGTILVALLLWVLSLLNQVPLLGKATGVVRDTIQHKQE
jgi:Domain of unknown function (DUF5665)